MKLEVWIVCLASAAVLGLALVGCRSPQQPMSKEAVEQDLGGLRESPTVWGWTTSSPMGGVEVQIEVAPLTSTSWEIDSIRTWIVESANLPNGASNPQIASPVMPQGGWTGATHKQGYASGVYARVEVRLRASNAGAFVRRIYWRSTALTSSKSEIPYHSDIVEGP